MKSTNTIANLAAALVAAQAELRAVSLDGSNPDYRSKYASLDNIITTIRPVLAKHGLAVVQGATTPHSDEAGRIAAVAIETMLVHNSGEWLTNTAIMPVVGRMLKGGGRAEPDPQAGGSALTYGRRYGLAALLCLATGEDDDGNGAKQRSGGGTAGAANVARRAGQTATHTTGSTPATQPTRPAQSETAEDDPGAFIKPFGRGKGGPISQLSVEDLQGGIKFAREKNMMPISQLSVEDLQGGIKFAREKNIHADFIEAAEKYLAALGVETGA